jgi:hypothetical protein
MPDRIDLLELGEGGQALELSRSTNVVEESTREIEDMVVYGAGRSLKEF